MEIYVLKTLLPTTWIKSLALEIRWHDLLRIRSLSYRNAKLSVHP